MGCAIQATLTVTFIGLKGVYYRQGRQHSGEIVFAGLNAPTDADFDGANVQRITLECLRHYLQPRPRAAHKGLFGHVLLVGGNHGMPGAIMLATEAALCSGAGRVTVATCPEHLSAIAMRLPEVMAHGVEDAAALIPLLHGKSAVVIGPGLGVDEWAISLLRAVLTQDELKQKYSIVIDADALNLLAQHSNLLHECTAPFVVTPHPAEWARLLDSSIESCEQDRFHAIERLQRYLSQQRSTGKDGPVCVLKGSGTLIRQGRQTVLCSDGKSCDGCSRDG